MSLLALHGVSLDLGGRAVLREVSLEAGAGEFVALTGANGAGKSTLLDLAAGVRAAGSGRLEVCGRAAAAWGDRELARRLVHLPQAVGPETPFSAEQVVAMGRYPHTDRWFESEGDHRAVRQAMERTGCWEERGRRMSTLSGGERQRVLLAACLAQGGEVLLMDEPSTYLDVEHQLACFSLLREEAAGGKLCVAVTHDLNLALTFCTRLVVLAEGRVAWDGSTVAAGSDPGWLGLFSSRLRLGRTESGAPWVWYR